MSSEVDILLATYNGQKYIEQQLNSIVGQSYSNWKLYIRDDGSIDDTLAIVKRYISNYPEKMYLVEDGLERLGPAKSFEQLCVHSDSKYIAFCDQDDVWLPFKLQLQIEKMIELEEVHKTNKPILVHTDLVVVDDRLNLVSESFWQYQHLAPGKMSTLRRQLVQNCVTGCTVLINRSLIELALPIPQKVIMHDWWLALVAVSEGVMCEVNVPTVKYRQHENNDTGAKHWGLRFIIKSIKRGRDLQIQSLLKTRTQAVMLLESNVLSDKNRKIVERYISMYSGNWFLRRIKMFRMGFFKYGLFRNIAMFLRI